MSEGSACSRTRIVVCSAWICLGLWATAASASDGMYPLRTAPAVRTCDPRMVPGIPPRAAGAPTGSEVARRVEHLSALARDALIRSELIAGNMPQFLRHLAPVRITGNDAAHPLELTVCVLPDYLAVGSDRDFVFVPMGLEAALDVARRFGFELPTPNLVDAIYEAAPVKLDPLPLPPGEQMRSTAYFVYHNELIRQQRAALPTPLGELTSGDKKDLVLSSRLWTHPGRVAIYGWHRGVGEPIQPLSTVHGARYADYSHGVRLVSDTAYVNGVRRSLREIFAEPALARLLTDEGPWPQLPERLTALMSRLSREQATH